MCKTESGCDVPSDEKEEEEEKNVMNETVDTNETKKEPNYSYHNTSQHKMLQLLNETLSHKISRHYSIYEISDNDNSSQDDSESDDDMSLLSYDSLEFSFDETL